ncbi:isoamyl acetate-hydrolyzing esterase 1 homolog [Lingula anatina]|uniref:Isoamyl acetate-hydrolyzing esterase 1 homolog n=1 Tax=Lingula anatina TaxID=7574 RepID=A0A1S3HB61_LINAN|nr:isoamyl acetate-hydrolyzing esterase 1 homolog [Lingula anatina]|eukprot:XP_013382384.1 isoamyl acetate-hydrolyzing esterase 1 homolog [Lingula anatina]
MAISVPKVLLFGSSSTQYGYSEDGCWVSVIADKLQRRCDVINRGYSGYNTRWARLMLPKLVTKETANDIAAMVIFFGANDSVLKDLNPHQHVPLEEYQDNLSSMITYLKSCGLGSNRIILIGPPPCDEQHWKERMDAEGRPQSKSQEQTALYAKACESVHKSHGTGFVDLYTDMLKAGAEGDSWKSFLNDGLHFSAAGSKFLAERLWQQLEGIVSDIGMIFPDWKTVDYVNPEAVFSAIN